MKEVETVPAKRLLLPARMRDDSFFLSDYTCNLYRGCNHGCVYCDSRSVCYHIDRFDTVRVKKDALKMLEDELRRKRSPGIVTMGAASDPYNKVEERLEVTRGALSLLLKYGFGVGMSTKSALISRDADVLGSMAKKTPVQASFSITTAEDSLAALLEPHAPPSSARFAAMRALAEAGVLTGVWMNPMLPFITDLEENVRAVVRLTKEHGGRYVICFFGMTLREGDREYFYQALDSEPRFLGVRQKYVDAFGLSYVCPSPKAAALASLMREECDRAGLFWRFRELNQAMARRQPEQLSFF